jgi:hypothetical protein
MTGPGLRGMGGTDSSSYEHEVQPHQREPSHESKTQSGGCKSCGGAVGQMGGCSCQSHKKTKRVKRALSGGTRGYGKFDDLTGMPKEQFGGALNMEPDWRFEAAQRGFGGGYHALPGSEGPPSYHDPNAPPTAKTLRGQGKYGESAPSYPGEEHKMLTVPYKPYRVRANFLGEKTHVSERLRRGDKPVTFVDAVARDMDFSRSMLKRRIGQAGARLRSGRLGARDKKTNLDTAEQALTQSRQPAQTGGRDRSGLSTALRAAAVTGFTGISDAYLGGVPNSWQKQVAKAGIVHAVDSSADRIEDMYTALAPKAVALADTRGRGTTLARDSRGRFLKRGASQGSGISSALHKVRAAALRRVSKMKRSAGYGLNLAGADGARLRAFEAGNNARRAERKRLRPV